MNHDYTYNGPATSFAFADEGGNILWQGAAHPNRTLKELPSEHEHVKALIAAGTLTRVELPARVAETATDTGTSKPSVKKGKEE